MNHSDSTEQQHSESPWLTPDEALDYLKWKGAAPAFRSAVARLGIPHRRIGRQLRFKRSELDEWMDRQKPAGAKDVARRKRGRAA